MNWLDFIVLGIVVLLVLKAILIVYKRKKLGKTCSGCGSCPYVAKCSKQIKHK